MRENFRLKPGLLHLIPVMVALCGITNCEAQKKLKHFTHQDTLRGSMNPARMYDVRFYDLSIKIEPDKKYISGSNIITFQAMQVLDSLQIDLFANMQVDSIILDKTTLLKFNRDGDHIFAYLPAKISSGSKHDLKICYHGQPREAVKPPWDGGFVWAKDSMGRQWIAVACEGLGASLWWPCKDYLGDKPDSMKVKIKIPLNDSYEIGDIEDTAIIIKGFCKINGNGKSYDIANDKVKNKGDAIFQSIIHYPINNYDVTLNIGNYEFINDGIYLPPNVATDTFAVFPLAYALNYYPLAYHSSRARRYFPARVKKMLRCFEHYFGPYPFPKDGYSLVETPYWGMEHQSCIAYGNDFKDSTLGFNFDFILIHESAHEWWGNSLSCADQAEMWLHESFATYAEALYVEYYWGYDRSVEYLTKQKERIANKEPVIGPMGVNYYERPDNDIYYKGAWMLHTLRSAINNDTLWFKIIFTFAQRFEYKTVYTQDFTNLVNKMTGHDYSAFFEQYLTSADLPILEYSYKKKADKLKLKYRWATKVKGFSIPVEFTSGNTNNILNPDHNWQTIEIPYSTAIKWNNSRFLYIQKDIRK